MQSTVSERPKLLSIEDRRDSHHHHSAPEPSQRDHRPVERSRRQSVRHAEHELAYNRQREPCDYTGLARSPGY